MRRRGDFFERYMSEAAGKTIVNGVILAAGLASRFGQNKLLQPLAGRPLFRHALEAALESGLHELVLVCGPELARIAPQKPRLTCVLNPKPQLGQAGSLRLGLEAAAPRCSHVLFMLADQPLITRALIDHFIHLALDGRDLACLGWQSDLGPPSLFGRRYFSELAGLEGDRGAGALLQ